MQEGTDVMPLMLPPYSNLIEIYRNSSCHFTQKGDNMIETIFML